MKGRERDKSRDVFCTLFLILKSTKFPAFEFNRRKKKQK